MPCPRCPPIKTVPYLCPPGAGDAGECTYGVFQDTYTLTGDAVDVVVVVDVVDVDFVLATKLGEWVEELLHLWKGKSVAICT